VRLTRVPASSPTAWPEANEFAIHLELTEVVDNDAEAAFRPLVEEAFEEGRLPRAEEAGEEGYLHEFQKGV
jgi:hypothetical protein